MTKHKSELAHSFITQALTNKGVNLSIYEDETFRQSLRLVAIDSIISILNRIYSKKKYALRHGQEFSIIDAINQIHPITGLNMLDYCLAAGFNDMALSLVHYGAVSKNLQYFRYNVHNSFPNDARQPDIVKDIYEIMNGCLEIKHNYDQFINKTQIVFPKMVSAGQRIYRGYSIPTLFMAGLGGVLLAPFLYPLIHGAGTTALLVSAGLIPAVFSGQRPREVQGQQPQGARLSSQNELATLKHLIRMATNTKNSLNPDKTKASQKRGKHKKHILQHPPQVPLLFQLPTTAKTKKASNSAVVTETLKKSMAS